VNMLGIRESRGDCKLDAIGQPDSRFIDNMNVSGLKCSTENREWMIMLQENILWPFNSRWRYLPWKIPCRVWFGSRWTPQHSVPFMLFMFPPMSYFQYSMNTSNVCVFLSSVLCHHQVCTATLGRNCPVSANSVLNQSLVLPAFL